MSVGSTSGCCSRLAHKSLFAVVLFHCFGTKASYSNSKGPLLALDALSYSFLSEASDLDSDAVS